MKQSYFESVMLVERLHRLFLETIKYELEIMKIEDINNVQCMILYNIGAGQLSVGELTNRGYYLGSNVSYNLRKMVQSGYVVQEQAPHDKRSSRIRLSDKGLALYHKLDEIIERQVHDLEKINLKSEDLKIMVKWLHDLEDYWESLCLNNLRN